MIETISTISAYQIHAEAFFETLRERRVDLLLDVRLKNTSQLCGFTKKTDLSYLVPALCHADYRHDLCLAPDTGLLARYLKHAIDWEQYAAQYLEGLRETDAADVFRERYRTYRHICLLGTATDQRRSHTEALVAYLQQAGESSKKAPP